MQTAFEIKFYLKSRRTKETKYPPTYSKDPLTNLCKYEHIVLFFRLIKKFLQFSIHISKINNVQPEIEQHL